MKQVKALKMTLHPDGVAAPAQRAAFAAFEVVSACLTDFSEGELNKPELPNQFIHYQFKGPELTSEQRRQMYGSWLLAKGFHDLARGVRETLEEAKTYLEMVTWQPQRPTFPKFHEDIAKIRKHAGGLTFPKLLAKVNLGLTNPVMFEAAFLSIQKARNCFEHRGGIVGPQDCDDQDTALTLSFPRLKVFYCRQGEEVEIRPNEPVDAQDGQAEVQLLGRIELRSKRYRQGERITLTARDFGEIAMACHYFASDLARKLPTLPQTSA